MQTVSTQFTTAVNAANKVPQWGCLISWKKNISSSVKFFTLDQSHLDGPDKLKGSGSTITFFDKYDYQNESIYVKSFKVTRKISNRPWGVIMATAELELNNTTKRFMPDYDGDIGAYVGLPERPIKLSMGYGGEQVKLFTGYTNRPDSQLVKRVTKITAYDAMTYLSGVKSNLGAFVNTPMHEIIEALLIEQGFGTDQFVIEKSLQQNIGYFMPRGKFVADILNEFCEAEAYTMFCDEDGLIRGWNRLHLLGNKAPLWTFTYSNMTDVAWSSAPIINSAVYIAKPFKPAPWNKIWRMDQASDETLVPPGGTVNIIASFRDESGDFPAINVDAPVHVSLNAGSSIYYTNYNQDGSGATGAAYISLSSVYNFGNEYLMTFANSGGVPIYITGIQLFGVVARINIVDSKPQEAVNSIAKYGINPENGKQTYEVSNGLVQDAATANTMAWLLANTYAEPLSRMTISNFVVPHLQYGDAVNVHIADTDTTKYCNIMGMELSVGAGANITQSLYVEERKPTTYVVLDNTNIDSGRLAL